jgi:hypothetical protein
LIAEACDSAGDLVDRGEKEPVDGAFDGSFEVFGEAAIAVEPRKGSFDHPAPRQQHEALGLVGTLDDFERPFADFGQRRAQFVYGISAIGKHMAQPGEAVADAGEHVGRAIALFNISGVDDGAD